MEDSWVADQKVYYIQGGAVLKGRVKRQLESADADYVLHNQKRIKVCDMHQTREDAEKVLAGVTVVDGGSETLAATGAQDSDKGQAEHVGAAPAGSPNDQADASAAGDTGSASSTTNEVGAAPAGSSTNQADASAAGGTGFDSSMIKQVGAALAGSPNIAADAPAAGDKDSDKVGATPVGNPQIPSGAPAAGNTDSLTRTTERMDAATAERPPILVDEPAAGGGASDTEHIGAAPAERLEIDANTYTREVAQWLTSLASKASERGVCVPVILLEMCPSPQKPARRSWNWYLGCPARVTPRCFDVR